MEGEGKAIRDICEMRIGKKVANNRRGGGGSSGCNVGRGGDMLMVVGAHQPTCQTARLLSDWSRWTAATVAQSDRVDTGPAESSRADTCPGPRVVSQWLHALAASASVTNAFIRDNSTTGSAARQHDESVRQ